MNKLTLYILTSFALLVGTAGCEKGFDEMNVNPVQPTALNPINLLNRAMISTTNGGYNHLVYEIGIVQQLVSPNGGVLTGANFNLENRDAAGSNWREFYRGVLKHTADVKQMTANDPTRANLYHMSRIWHSLSAMILTDTYGDVPYSEAGLGYLNNNVSPKYDAQQAIYQDVMKELEQAAAALDKTKPVESGDILYAGDIDKWKHLGFSLLLRAAMRHTKVAPDVAQQYVAKAAAGGVMQSNADNAAILHNAAYTNSVGGTLNGGERNNFYLAEPFVNYLKANNDPRLAAIAVRYVGAKNGGEQVAARESRAPEVQIGMPMGYDNATIQPVATQKGLASFYDFSQLDRNRMGGQFAPAFLVTHAQTQLLMAEAVVRGWIPGDAAAMYAEAIRAHMNQLASYGAITTVPAAAIDAYIQAHPFDSARALEQINTEYWVASFLNPYEAFANFRRSGYPGRNILPPNPFPGKGITGEFIRRLVYPDTEYSVNLGNIQEAVSRQGADKLDTPVWWDKQ
ncbi:MAG: Cell surface glycan-binding lipoprotein, utilization system for glycans and polysaccharides (PUL), SusD family [uncultured Adhaeribacter sp.]|uniref:Cell surface glycan-binding lipoprotein, utilization system for glycans and polysaccharides (PUL), SusD family n=1 Tax=uncultured Adhaeribacter sp. TaxID=448109 RepID=A0A6J4JWJ2_9BACT|nr:MAG: Cell surface glycan-binding lipoprotein, utilization system for glycans and polysaccharides (PUL), SusD family [uncultured Adhaeribacter sp.]